MVSGIPPIAVTGSVVAVAGGTEKSTSTTVSSPFAEAFQAAAKETAALDRNAAQQVTDLITGKGTDVHSAMISTQKAELAFELALQVRNKAVSAYQQMMQTQF